jgi:CRP-like cAMP-binding protein
MMETPAARKPPTASRSTNPLGSPFPWKHGPVTPDDEDIALLCRIGLFQSVRPRDLIFMARVSQVVVAEPGEEVISQDSVADFFYVVIDGLLRVRIRSSGKSMVVAYLTRGQYVGEKAIMDASRRSATIQAARETRLIRVPGFTFRRIMSRPENRWRLDKKVQERERSNVRIMTKVAGIKPAA